MRTTSMVDALTSTLLLSSLVGVCAAQEALKTDPATTSTAWRDDVKNIEITRKLNEAYARRGCAIFS